MTEIKFRGQPIHTIGKLPKVGSIAPDFLLTDGKFNDHSLKDYAGKKKILSVVPSLDTDTCSTSAKKFNELTGKLSNVAVLVVSADLPFAQKRFCDAEKCTFIITLSMLRTRDFAKDYGVLMIDGPLAGICSRAVVVLDENNKILYTEQVGEIVHEPDYDSAINALTL